MDFKKLGQQVGQLKKQAEEKLGDRAEPDNLKRDARELREILAGDGSLAEKAKQAKKEVIDRDKPANRDEPANPASRDEPANPANRDEPANPANRDEPANPAKPENEAS